MDDLPFTIEITMTGNYPIGMQQHAKVAVAGEGDLDHMLTAFRAAMMAAGIAPDTAASLRAETEIWTR